MAYRHLMLFSVALLTAFCLLALCLPALCRAQVDTATASQQMHNAGTSAPVLTYSLVEGGLPLGSVDGGANQTSPPGFVDRDGPDALPGTLDDDLRLRQDASAIDAGTASALPADTDDLDSDGDTTEPLPVDLAGNQRMATTSGSVPTVDLGAYEYGATPVPTEEAPGTLPGAVVLTPAYPNPFNPETTLHFGVARSVPVRVTLYDALGRSLRTLYEGTPAPGVLHSLTLQAEDLPSGLYLVRLVGGGIQATRTLMLVR